MAEDDTDILIVLLTSSIWGLAWLGLLVLVSLIMHRLRGAKAIDYDGFLTWAVHIGVVAIAGLAVGAVFVWVIWQWKPDFGFWGRFVHHYWRLGEGGLLIGVSMMTALLALLRRGKNKRKR